MLKHAGIRVLMTAGVVATAAALAGLSTWASFTDSTSATHSVSTGAVDLDLGAAGTGGNRLDVHAENLAPGDVVERAVELHNSSTIALQGVTLTTAATTSSALDTDATHGLQLRIERCSVPWTESGSAPSYTYSCSGVTDVVVATRPVIGTALPLAGISLAAGSGTSYLRVTTTLPSSAGNAFQGLETDLSYTFTGVQRVATDR